eukprot:1146887-Pelagomonas_calceolata.AAC.5
MAMMFSGGMPTLDSSASRTALWVLSGWSCGTLRSSTYMTYHLSKAAPAACAGVQGSRCGQPQVQ